MKSVLGLLAVPVLALALVGCSKQDAGKCRLTGTVTLDGRPLVGGQIDLLLWEISTPKKGAIAGALIDEDGKYEIKVMPGRYRVVVYGSRHVELPGLDSVAQPPKGMPGNQEKRTPLFSDPDKTPLSVQLEPGEQTKDFSLKSKL